MKKMIFSAFALLGCAISTNAQATATATATATIVTPISISKTADMSFGNIAVSATTSGTVILSPAGSRTTGGAGGVTLPADGAEDAGTAVRGCVAGAIIG